MQKCIVWIFLSLGFPLATYPSLARSPKNKKQRCIQFLKNEFYPKRLTEFVYNTNVVEKLLNIRSPHELYVECLLCAHDYHHILKTKTNLQKRDIDEITTYAFKQSFDICTKIEKIMEQKKEDQVDSQNDQKQEKLQAQRDFLYTYNMVFYNMSYWQNQRN